MNLEALARDELMIGHAQQRGQVIVTHQTRRRLAVLRCWWPTDYPKRYRAGQAMVEFSNGKTHTVPHDQITPIEPLYPIAACGRMGSDISDPGSACDAPGSDRSPKEAPMNDSVRQVSSSRQGGGA